MAALALAVLLAAAGGPPVNVPAPAPEAQPAPAPELRLGGAAGGPSLGALVAPAVLLAGLAGAALLLARRKGHPGRLVQVLETTALGPKRSLVLARLGGEVLLLGSSEAGITLLRSQPAEPGDVDVPVPEDVPPPPARRRAPAQASPALAGLASRLRRVRPGTAPETFDAVLTESAEDQELRRKLARGQAGSVR